ncbi:MAG: ammonium transporter [Candidatus Solincola sediminis]|uniref:Ammonium transporter n=1 Tax=Candidatus Solincola sediminis TaxID=1797199 RepID=A0A1F2WMC2_9ACTN|nr:MAG: ammonium transporter [Candidatus Solincola sediminis]OFW61370.1 MAG: ammonium transporter [Candidatus Solincola sediminis]
MGSINKNWKILVMLAILLAVLLVIMVGPIKARADSSGEQTGTSQDLGEGSLEDQVGHNKIAINFMWVFLGAILVFFMQAGFAMVETGFTQERNAVHVMMTNFTIFAVGTLGYFLVGYALMFGGVGQLLTLGGSEIMNAKLEVAKGWSLFGLKGFALSGTGVYDVGIFLFFLFQVVFMDTAATIVTGGLAERWKFKAFLVYGVFMSAILYPVFGHWVWGGGWLSQLGANVNLGHGFVDFAGSSVVHAVGGLCALAGIYVIGPRMGRFDKEGKPRAIPGHNIPIAIVGVIILVFGWFGFNSASTLSGQDLRFAIVAVNTLLAACAGSLTAMFFMWKKFGKPDPSMTANGMLAGLVAITAPCAFVPSWAAIVIGIIAGFVVCGGVLLLERWRLDDPVGAVAVHGFNGLWGVLAVGLFADGTYGSGLNGVDGAVRGLFFGDAGQFLAQAIGAVACAAFVLGLSLLFFRLQDRIQGIRVSPQEEVDGLDVHEMGVSAYDSGTQLHLGLSHPEPEWEGRRPRKSRSSA